MLLIKCSQGKCAAVSEIDYPRVAGQKWYARRNDHNSWYALNRYGVGMHRYVMRATKGQIVDHIDGNGLNNVRDNLRICTSEQNNANRRIKKPKKFMPYRCVYRVRGGFRTKVHYRGQVIRGGLFETAEEAARDYDKIKVMLYGEYACTHEAQGLLGLADDELAEKLLRESNAR